MISIRRRLLIGLLAAVGLVWIGIAVLIYYVAQHEAEEVFDAQLAQYARALQALVAEQRRDGAPQPLPADPIVMGAYTERLPAEGHRYERKLRLQIWDGDGRLLATSPKPLRSAAPTVAGYGTESVDGETWRTFALTSGPSGLRVFVAERNDVRDELVAEVVVRQLTPGLLALPFFGVVIWIVVGRGLRPLRRVAGEVARRSPEQLEPLRVAGAPTEVRPLVDALNRLFERLQTAFERERRFIADAAHELRTPLAAVKTQAQAAIAARDPEQRRRALDNIVRGVDRATHVEAQLLTLARLEPEARVAVRRRRVNFAPIAREVLAELAPSALAKRVEISLSAGSDVEAYCDPDLMAILLRNLVDNAIRHTPERGTVGVAIEKTDAGVVLSVTDTGPGIPSEDRERVFERFYRSRPQAGSGSGLGLSIVKRIADLHEAGVTLDGRPGGGLIVTMRLPTAPPH